MPDLLDVTEFCKDLKCVTSRFILLKNNKGRKFDKNGLFSEQIFGPVTNFTCQCGEYMGSSSTVAKCTKCDVDITRSIERRRRFAKIVLPFSIVNPVFYDLVVSLGGKEVKTPLDFLMKNEDSVLYVKIENNDLIVKTEDDEKYKPKYYKKYERTEAIYELIKILSEDLIDVIEWKYVNDNLDKLLIKDIIVLPPELRPISKSAREGQQKADPLNQAYLLILNKVEEMLNTLIELSRNKRLYYDYFKIIQKATFEIYEYILSKISKKEGLIRKNILGKRIDFSGRAVITPDPTLDLDECYLPYSMVLELFKLQISKKLIDIEKFKFINTAIEFVDQCAEFSNQCLFEVCEDVVKNEYCFLNRQPSLHRLSLIGFKIKVSRGNTIKIHPLVCPGFNADFDGDQMAVYIPLSNEAKEEVKDKFLASKNLFAPSNCSLTTTPSQDIVLGVYILTNNMIPSHNEKVLYKNETMTEGMKIFNECLPEDYPVVNYTVRKKELISILNDINENYKREIIVETLDKIKDVGFKFSTLYGVSLSLENINNEDISNFKDTIYKNSNLRDQLEIISSKETEKMLNEKFKYSYLIDSGARGSWDQARQIMLTRGFVSNFNGEILPTPVKGNLLEGLTQKEFFISTYGCRKGLLDVAVNTGTSGYLSRKLIFTCANLQKSRILEDCGTDDYLKVFVESEKKAQILEYRYWLNPDTNNEELITKDNYKNLIGKHILLRSPIYCKSEKICHKCYGKLWEILDTEFVGIVAAQTLGEVGTQLVLRIFHNSLSKNTKILDVNNKQYTIEDVYEIVKSGNPFYTFSCSPEGRIVVSKVIDAHKDRFERKIIRVTLDNGEIVKCTYDHEWIMRNGSHKLAKDLSIGDSLMPIYIEDDENKKYRKLRHNILRRSNQFGNYETDLIYKLSSNHRDCENICAITEDEEIHRHHKDLDSKNDYPCNIKIISKDEHFKIHSDTNQLSIYIEKRKSDPEVDREYREKTYPAVSESNRRRTQDSEWVEKFNAKRNKTLEETNFGENQSKLIKKNYEENPDLGKHCIMEARKTSIINIINELNDLGLVPSNLTFNIVRRMMPDNGNHHPTFEYVKENHPELVENYEIIIIPEKSKQQLASENRMNKILDKMIDSGLDMTVENFDMINKECYPTKNGFISREKLLTFSNNYLSHLENTPNNHKIVKVEFVELPEYEEFYDLTVDSEYHNFALGAGVFIHNSGVAQIKNNDENHKEEDDMKQMDIIGDLSSVSRLLHVKSKDINEHGLVEDLYNVYSGSRNIHYVHFESVVAQLMWKNNRKWRLLKDREKHSPQFYSIQTVPEKESWILGLAFSNPKKNILRGVIHSGNYDGILDKILLGKKL